MNYSELLQSYSRIPIALEDVKYLLKSDYSKVSDLKPYLFNLVSSCDIFDSSKLNIILTSTGIVIDITTIKKIVLQYFGLPDDVDTIDRLEFLEEGIKNESLKNPDFSPMMLQAFSNYRMRSYINPKAKPNTINRAKRKEFMFKTRMDIRKIKELIKNGETSIKANDVFDEDKLKIYIAYKIMKYAMKCLKNHNDAEFRYAMEYLQKFLDKNEHLINQDYCLQFVNMDHGTGKKTIKKEYKISEIVAFVNSMISHEKSANLPVIDVEKYDYSFFELDEPKIKEIFEIAKKIVSAQNNSGELEEILNRKIALYESLNIVKIKIGVDSFDGYIGLQLDNGKVILDKFFEDRKLGKIATDNAIYIIRLEDFEKITKMSKTSALDAINLGLIDAIRIYHSGEYEQRVKNYLTRTKPTQNKSA